MQRVTPPSSSSSPFSAKPSSPIGSKLLSLSSLGISTTSAIFSFSLPLRFERREPPLLVTPFLCSSSSGSSSSSCFARLLRPLLLWEVTEGRLALSLDLGFASDGGEPAGDLLDEGAGRRPERRGSFGEGGGPIVATLAIGNVGRWGEGMRKAACADGGGKIQTMPVLLKLHALSGEISINGHSDMPRYGWKGCQKWK